jgi:hypothetical protein
LYNIIHKFEDYATVGIKCNDVAKVSRTEFRLPLVWKYFYYWWWQMTAFSIDPPLTRNVYNTHWMAVNAINKLLNCANSDCRTLSWSFLLLYKNIFFGADHSSVNHFSFSPWWFQLVYIAFSKNIDNISWNGPLNVILNLSSLIKTIPT